MHVINDNTLWHLQDKENRRSPANAPAEPSEPQAASSPNIASPAFLTPARFSETIKDVQAGICVADRDKACQPSTSASTHTAFAASTPKIDDASSSSAARAAAHAETTKQHRARTRLGNPAFSTPAISQCPAEHAATPAEAEQVSEVSVKTPFAHRNGS